MGRHISVLLEFCSALCFLCMLCYFLFVGGPRGMAPYPRTTILCTFATRGWSHSCGSSSLCSPALLLSALLICSAHLLVNRCVLDLPFCWLSCSVSVFGASVVSNHA